MILSALASYYEQILSDHPDRIPAPGWCSRQVKFILELSQDGELFNVIPSQEKRGWEKTVPSQVKRSSGIAANFLCDTSSYFLGVDAKGKPERSMKCFEAARALHTSLLSSVDSDCARAIVAFFDTWDPSSALEHPAVMKAGDELLAGGNLAFACNCNGDYLEAVDDPAIRKAWVDKAREAQDDSFDMTCLVTGARGPVARLHPAIKGVYGAQSMGASLVGFNAPAFESYGHEGEQGRNAPVSVDAAEAYGAALNYLLSDEKHHFRLGDTTIVFWSETCDDGNCDLMNELMGNVSLENRSSAKRDDVEKALAGVLSALLHGKLPEIDGIDFGSTFYVLGIAPNAARLAVRFFMRDEFGSVLRNVARYYDETNVIHAPFEPERLTPFIALKSLENGNSKTPVVSSQLSASFMRAVFEGGRYPDALYSNALLRMRATHKVGRSAAALIKAYLLRNAHYDKKEITVELNRERNEVAYALGRAFSLYERIQSIANGGNSNIAVRYINSACTTPAVVFPVLARLSEAHLAKIAKDKPGLAVVLRKDLCRIMDSVETYPVRMGLREQGDFSLGYYHQSQEHFASAGANR